MRVGLNPSGIAGRARTAAVFALLAFSATSCSSDAVDAAAPTTPEAVTEAPSEPSPTEEVAEPPAAGVAQPGLLTVSCVGATGTLERRSPETGEILASLDVESAMGGTGERTHSLCFGERAPSNAVQRLRVRQQFNDDFSSITFTGAEQADGAQHVGVSDLAGTQVLDITELTSSDGFSGEVPVDSSPVFDDAGDVFFLRDTNAGGGSSTNTFDVYKFDMAAQTGTVVGTAETQDFIGSSGARYLTVQQGHPVVGDFLFSPSGKLVAQPSAGATLFFPAPSGGSVVAENPLKDGSSLAPGSYYGGQAQSITQAWLDGKRLLVSAAPDDGDFDLFAVPVRTGERAQVESVRLLPESTRTNFGAQLSPDKTQMTFISRQGGVESLYRVALDAPGQQPVEVLSSFTGFLLGWD